jgi:hypothetical protein
MAVQYLHRKYDSIIDSSCPVTLERAIQLAEKGSSAGFYYKRKMKITSKGELYTNYPDHVKKIIKMISDGECVPVIWENGPKVEVRVISKINDMDPTKRKQRTFMCSDAIHYIVGLMVWHEQNEKLKKQAYDPTSMSAVGVTIFYGGWDAFARMFLRLGIRFRCKDVKAMESTLVLQVQKAIYKVRLARYKRKPFWNIGEFEKDLNFYNLALWWVRNVIYSIVMDVLGDFYLTFGQNPSGQNNTLYDNIWWLTLVFVYHFSKKFVDFELMYSEINKFIIKLMGDDSLYLAHYVWDEIGSSALELGMEMTDEIEGDVPLEQAKFCGFRWKLSEQYGQYTYAPDADCDKLIASILYYRKNNSYRFTFVKLCAMKVLFAPNADNKYDWICEMISY